MTSPMSPTRYTLPMRWVRWRAWRARALEAEGTAVVARVERDRMRAIAEKAIARLKLGTEANHEALAQIQNLKRALREARADIALLESQAQTDAELLRVVNPQDIPETGEPNGR